MSPCSPLKFGSCDISYTIFYTKFNIFYINSIHQDHFITFEKVIRLTKLFQCCFLNADGHTLNVRRLNFHFQRNINVDVPAGKAVTLRLQ